MKFMIWDLPTRLFHWLFAGSVVLAFVIAQTAEKETPVFYLHVVFGVLAGLLIVWRVLWGFIGSRYARWKELLFSPASIVHYFKEVFTGKGAYYAGHNPGGALAILGMLGLVFLTVLSGIFITQAEVFEELHEVLPVMAMILAGVHVAGVLLATKMHGENYMLSMINGQKKGVAADAIPGAKPVAAVLMLVLVFGGWTYFIKGFNRDSAVFTAPGTQWTYQIGEAEEKGETGAGERGERESEENENSERGAGDPAVQGVKAGDQEGAAAPSEESEKYTRDDDGDDD